MSAPQKALTDEPSAPGGARRGSTHKVGVVSVNGEETHRGSDTVATEEPLELRLVLGGRRFPITVTMRTPGADFELAVGLLHGEGVLRTRADVARLSYCTDPKVDAAQQFNIVNVELASGAAPDLRSLERTFVTTSACGVCGKASLEALELRGAATVPPGPRLDPAVLVGLPDRLRAAQGLFEVTGGLHAAGIFRPDGELVVAREDVGRHNAVDKVIGWALLNDHLPLHDRVLVVSGRASYEILQKALAAGLPMVVAVSAPSSLAVDLAARFAMTLIGFLRGDRFNIYTGPDRLLSPEHPNVRVSPASGGR
ncbi:formate dehydrogenase accessory sulfurtransferase FdhD [soil metagenome]